MKMIFTPRIKSKNNKYDQGLKVTIHMKFIYFKDLLYNYEERWGAKVVHKAYKLSRKYDDIKKYEVE